VVLKFAVSLVDVRDAVLVPRDANREARRKIAHRHHFNYTPKAGFLYVRSRAISSRCNDNFDEFPAEEIEKSYRTFIGKPVFVNHHNEDHRKARGVIIDAALHRDTLPTGAPDVWCEVLMEVDAQNFPKLAKEIIDGNIDRTSMGCDVEYSICSICGNKATSPAEYCQHIPRMKGQRVWRTEASTGKKKGVLVREICYGLRFFENSLLVEEPADPTAVFTGVDTSGLGMSKAAARDQATCPHPMESRSLHDQCKECGAFPNEDDTPCSDPWCVANEGPHTEAEHVDPPHRDPYHPDYQSAEHGVEEAFGEDRHLAEQLLDGQPTGPTKYSSKTASGPFGHFEYAEGDPISLSPKHVPPHIDDDPVHGSLMPDQCPGCRQFYRGGEHKVCPTCQDELIGTPGGTYDAMHSQWTKSLPITDPRRSRPWSETPNHEWAEHNANPESSGRAPKHKLPWWEPYDAITDKGPQKRPDLPSMRPSLSSLAAHFASAEGEDVDTNTREWTPRWPQKNGPRVPTPPRGSGTHDHLTEAHGVPTGKERGKAIWDTWMANHVPGNPLPKDDGDLDISALNDHLSKQVEDFHKHLHGGDLSNDVGHSHPMMGQLHDPTESLTRPPMLADPGANGGTYDPMDPNVHRDDSIFRFLPGNPPEHPNRRRSPDGTIDGDHCSRTYPLSWWPEEPKGRPDSSDMPALLAWHASPEMDEWREKHTCPECGAMKSLHAAPYSFDPKRITDSKPFTAPVKQSLNALAAHFADEPEDERTVDPEQTLDAILRVHEHATLMGHEPEFYSHPTGVNGICKHCFANTLIYHDGESLALHGSMHSSGCDKNPASPGFQDEAQPYYPLPQDTRSFRLDEGPKRSLNHRHAAMDDNDVVAMRQHMIEEHGFEPQQFWRDQHDSDHPALDLTGNRPLRPSEIRRLHHHTHATEPTLYPGYTTGEGHQHHAALDQRVVSQDPFDVVQHKPNSVLRFRCPDCHGYEYQTLAHDQAGRAAMDALVQSHRCDTARTASRKHAHGDHETPDHGPLSDDGDQDYRTLHHHKDGSTFIPMLGCHKCDATFYHQDARAAHIKENHPGEYSGPSQGQQVLNEIFEQRKAEEEAKAKGYYGAFPHIHHDDLEALHHHLTNHPGHAPGMYEGESEGHSYDDYFDRRRMHDAHAAAHREMEEENPEGKYGDAEFGYHWHMAPHENDPEHDAVGTDYRNHIPMPNYAKHPKYDMGGLDANTDHLILDHGIDADQALGNVDPHRWHHMLHENHDEEYDGPLGHGHDDPPHQASLASLAAHFAAGEYREHKPDGISPQEEWHGPYEVVRHPETQRYHVVDNQGRNALFSRHGWDDPEAAHRSRDYIDKDRASREKAKGMADRIFNGAMEILDPGGTEESRRSQRNMDSASNLLNRYEPHHIKYDENDEPYAVAHHPSGWEARDYGGPNVHIYHRATGEEAHDLIDASDGVEGRGGIFTPGYKPVGYGHPQLKQELHNWVSEVGDDYESSIPKIQRWKRQGRRTASGANDRHTLCEQGHLHWGAEGAAGLLLRHRGEDGQTRYLLQKRGPNVDSPNTHSIPGGAIAKGETPEQAAMRESKEEMGALPNLRVSDTHVNDHGGWAYHTVIADVDHRFDGTEGGTHGHEQAGTGWYTADEIGTLRLHPGFAASWDEIKKRSAR
jgi:8-oxo-dGTP pyrophosphatase MutT (NUDIX family)